MNIKLFGTLSLLHRDIVVTRFSSLKASALFAYLSFYSNRPHSREFLAEMFWPDKMGDASRLSLRVALNSLKKQLEPLGVEAERVILSDRNQIQLNANLAVTDVAQFKEALKIANARQTDVALREMKSLEAVELYCGELLPGFNEDWIWLERDRLAGECSKALMWLAERNEMRCEFLSAVSFATKAAVIAPIQEDVQFRLIQLYIASSRIPEAVKHFLLWEKNLRENFDSIPSKPMIEIISPFLNHSTSLSEVQNSSSNELSSRVKQVPNGDSLSEICPTPAQRGVNPHAPLTRFFGREEEIADLLNRLSPSSQTADSSRLITLCGVGGAGKSRLALELARRISLDFERDCLYIPLADISDWRQIPSEILRALSTGDYPENEPLEAVVAALGTRMTLLILDNFEHLLSGDSRLENGSGKLVDELLHRLPNLACIITSRQALNIEGEITFPVRPFPLPPPGLPLETLSSFDALRLFIDRAILVRPDFQLTPTNSEPLVKLCVRLDGIPLAIELAAALGSVLTPSEMLERLSSSQEILTSRYQNLPERHRSLQSAISWSVDRLSPELKRFCLGLSVFRGGWTVESAQNVCLELRAIPYFSELLEKSLIVAEETPQGMRFRMLETIRQFCLECMNQAERDALSHRHLDFYATLAERFSLKLQGAEQSNALDLIERELPNLRMAMALSLTEGEPPEIAWKLGAALWEFWLIRGYVGEGREFLEAIFACKERDETSSAFGEALNGAGALAQTQGDFVAAKRFYLESLSIRRRLGNQKGVASSLNNMGLIAELSLEYASAKSLHEESLAIRREINDRRGIANSLNNLGVLMQNWGEYKLAHDYCRESLELKKTLNDKRQIAHSHNNLGIICHILGDNKNSHYHHTKSLALRRELGDRAGEAASLNNLGRVAETLGQLAEAYALFSDSLTLKRDLRDTNGIGRTFINLGKIEIAQEKWAKSAQTLSEATLIFEEEHSQSDLLALLLGWMLLASRRTEFERASVLLGIFERVEAQSDVRPFPNDLAERESTLTATSDNLGEDVCFVHRSHGKQLSSEEAMRFMLAGNVAQV